MEKWRNGEMEKWRNEEMEKWRNGEMETNDLDIHSALVPLWWSGIMFQSTF